MIFFKTPAKSSSCLPRRAVGEPVTFSIFSCFFTPGQMLFNPSKKASSCLPRRAVGEPVTFSIFSCFLHPTRCCFVPSRKASSCLSRRAVGAKRLADLSHHRGFMARSRRTSAMLVGRCSSELSGHRLQGKLKESQPLSEAPRRSMHNRGFMARSRGTPAMLVGRHSSELSGHTPQGKLKKSQPLRMTILWEFAIEGAEGTGFAPCSTLSATSKVMPEFL